MLIVLHLHNNKRALFRLKIVQKKKNCIKPKSETSKNVPLVVFWGQYEKQRNRFHQRSYHWNNRCYRVEIQSKIASVCCWRYQQAQNITDKHLNNELSVLLLMYDCRFVTIVGRGIYQWYFGL